MEFEWRPDEFFEEIRQTGKRNVLLVLNTPCLNEERLIGLWKRSAYRVLVDGGANSWFALTSRIGSDLSCPDLVTGDLDSVETEVLQHLQSKKDVKINVTPDQDATDFTKALHQVKGKGFDVVLAYVEHTGRLDQIFGLFETLHLAAKEEDLPPVFLVSSNSVEWLLGPGKHTIHLNRSKGKELQRRHCGLIPLGQPCPGVRTTGLKWNLDGSRVLAFGSLVSTSNGFESQAASVTIETSKPLLWTQEI